VLTACGIRGDFSVEKLVVIALQKTAAEIAADLAPLILLPERLIAACRSVKGHPAALPGRGDQKLRSGFRSALRKLGFARTS
jgi:hypothetical protein